MTVFFYSGITSYPGVSTEEKTISWFWYGFLHWNEIGQIERKAHFYILRKFLSVVETHSWYDSTSKTPPTRELAEFLGRELGCKTLEQ